MGFRWWWEAAKHNGESKGCVSSLPSAEDPFTLTLLLPQQPKSWVSSGFNRHPGSAGQDHMLPLVDPMYSLHKKKIFAHLQLSVHVGAR